MMTLLLVEDEPAALTILEKIIEKIPLEIQIVGRARNGLAAKEMIENQPEIDAVITDIKMPLMDGIELSEYIFEKKIDIEVVILSGFQEFSFAQKAIQFGVEEYLLKPIKIEEITEVLSKIASKREKKKKRYEKRLLENEIKKNGYTTDIHWNKRYQIITLHFGSFNGLVVYDDMEIKKKIAEFEGLMNFVINGRKRNEFVLIIQESSHLAKILGKIQEGFTRNPYIAIYSSSFITISELNSIYSKMSRFVELYHRIGVKEVFSFETIKDDIVSQKDSLNWLSVHSKLQDHYVKGHWIELEELLKNVVIENLNILTTQQLIDRSNHLLSFFNQYLEIEMQISRNIFEDVIFSSVEISDVVRDYQDLIEHFLDQSKRFPEKIDSYEFYQLIEQFLKQNFYRSDLNLTMISEHFGISMKSINDLFKKYKQQTFKEFMLDLRMEQAVFKMNQAPIISLKQIAEEVGYKDALYFSKVFKKHFGKSPSMFQEEIRNLDDSFHSK